MVIFFGNDPDILSQVDYFQEKHQGYIKLWEKEKALKEQLKTTKSRELNKQIKLATRRRQLANVTYLNLLYGKNNWHKN